ncbi:iron complex transport system substrate-binding protein [Deinobacterium chartae]|uniref:Iron complex transport system substrate-binding protein n=1 Tax=Deinobacterium chartae TaxID=521158 RepID=A0A841I0G6_9DEIO|nr:iron-siderophore ABC transporter substrate-binding protein [Deinobacterium chartae]MBB6097475.1 iron complex transport system substrate-binding protein [Deinobacterium chartae]
MRKMLVLTLLTLASAAAAQTCNGRLIEHAMGTSCVPHTPKRVVVLDTGELDSALALGVKPVGSVVAFEGAALPEYLKTRTAGIANVGTIQQPSLEKILALKPDLILSSKLRHGQIYAQLSRIAPTVMAETVGVTWKSNFLLDARALGKTAEANRIMAAYQNRIKNFQKNSGRARKATEVSVVRFVPGETRIMMKASFIGTVLEDAGLKRPKAQDKNVFRETASPERIPDLEGDVLFYSSYGPPEGTEQNLYLSSPLWKRLKVVQAGRAYRVSDDHWMLGIGILAANRVLDDLERYLASGR